MRRKKKRRLYAVCLLLLLLLAFALTWFRLLPTIEALAVAQAEDEASDCIAEAIAKQMETDDISYGDIVRLEKDGTGRLLALQTDMNQLNRLRNETLQILNTAIVEQSEGELGIPLGNILFPTLFSGLGPMLPVHIISIQNAGAEYFSSFSAAGINQTLHRIEMEVSLHLTLLTPAGTREIDTASTVVVAETILIGQVPSTMIQTQKNGE